MSDARDALAEAMALQKRLAAGRLVRKEELEAELTRLRAQRARLEGEAGVELDARIDAVTTELAAATSELQDALNEIKALEQLARDERAAGARAVVASATSDDPVLMSAEEIALQNARDHIRSLSAQAALDDLENADTPPADVKPSGDAEAKAEFERLRGAKPPKKTL